MQVANKDARRSFLPRGDGRVFTDASLADPSYFIDQGGDLVLRLWLPGGIAVEDVPAVPWNVYLNADVDDHLNLIVTKLRVEQRPGGRGITAAGLRTVLVGELVDELLSRHPVAQMVRRTDEHPDRWPAVDVDVPAELLAEARRRTQTQRGRAADPQEVRARLERVAEVARGAPPGKVLATLRDVLAISEGAAKKVLRQARDAGVLEHSARSAGGRR
jgi:hypothetical protein